MRNKKNESRILEDLSHGFQKRTVQADYMEDPEARWAYGDYYGEVSFKKGLELSKEILTRNEFQVPGPGRSIRILDLGTGTGAFLQGFLAGLDILINPSLPSEILCIDRSRSALVDLKKNWSEKYGLELQVRPGILPEGLGVFDDLNGLDVVLMANVLAENGTRVPGFASMIGRLAEKVTPGGILVLVEPSDRKASRALLGLGDHLRLLRSDLTIVAPCPNGRTGSCPALEGEDDWCHEDRPAQFSSGLRKKACALGHVKDSLKMSYLVFRKGGGPAGVPPFSLRLVSAIQKEKGQSWGIFCDGSKLSRIRLLNRTRSDRTRNFSKLKRGDTVICPDFLKTGQTDGMKTGGQDWPRDEPLIRISRADGQLYDNGNAGSDDEI